MILHVNIKLTKYTVSKLTNNSIERILHTMFWGKKNSLIN